MDTKTVQQAKKSSSALTKKQVTVFDAIQKQKPGFEMALPKNFPADKFVRVALTALRQNAKLQQCTQESILGALMLSAQFGLEPNSPLHEAALVPYGNKVEFQVEYRGLLKLVWNSGLVNLIDYDKICENDDYEYEKGFNSKFYHKPAIGKKRGNPIAYYAYAEMKNGGKALVLMSTEEIAEHGKRFSRAYNYKDSPWKTDFDAMAIKTVLRQLCDKKLPKATTNEALLFQQASNLDMSSKILPETQIGKRVDVGELEDDNYIEPAEVINTTTGEVTEVSPPKPTTRKRKTEDEVIREAIEVEKDPDRVEYLRNTAKDTTKYVAYCGDIILSIKKMGGDGTKVLERLTGKPTVLKEVSTPTKTQVMSELYNYWQSFIL